LAPDPNLGSAPYFIGTPSASLSITNLLFPAPPMITIPQGRCHPKPYFLVADPVEKPRARMHDQVKCVNPRNGEVIFGTVIARWTFNWEKDPLTALILLEYGVQPEVLREGLESKDPDFCSDNCSFLLIQEKPQ